jgi:hypothetical protein
MTDSPSYSAQTWRFVVLFGLAATGASAQWIHSPTPGIPRTRNSQPNLSGPAPRAANGKPDLSGLWQVERTPFDEMTRLFGPGLDTLSVPGDDLRDFSKYAINVLADFKPEDTPLRPEAARITQKNGESGGKDNPTSKCEFAGIPFGGLLPFPSKFVEAPGVIVILQEGDGGVRQIFTDGRKHTADPQPTWMGYSVGRWDRDAMVVDTTGFNDKAWIDGLGHPRSEAMRVEERYRRRDFGHMDVEVTLDDPKMYAKTFSIKYTLDLVPDSEIGEYVCAENEKDLAHFGK